MHIPAFFSLPWDPSGVFCPKNRSGSSCRVPAAPFAAPGQLCRVSAGTIYSSPDSLPAHPANPARGGAGLQDTLRNAGKGRNCPCRVTLSPRAQPKLPGRIWAEISGDIRELQNTPSWNHAGIIQPCSIPAWELPGTGSLSDIAGMCREGPEQGWMSPWDTGQGGSATSGDKVSVPQPLRISQQRFLPFPPTPRASLFPGSSPKIRGA